MTFEKLKELIRDVPDFPVKGIIFKDITPLLLNPKAFQFAVEKMTEPFKGEKVDKVMAVESRGFIFGAPIALKLNAGLVLIRKKGKLPWKTLTYSYSLEYGEETVEVHEDAINEGEKVLIVDDLLATGGTARAMIELAKKLGGKVAGVTFLIELTFLKGREKLKDYPVYSIIKY